MEAVISRDEAIARFAAFLDQQFAEGKQGEKWIAVNFDRQRRITSVKATEEPPRFKRLPPVPLCQSNNLIDTNVKLS